MTLYQKVQELQSISATRRKNRSPTHRDHQIQTLIIWLSVTGRFTTVADRLGAILGIYSNLTSNFSLNMSKILFHQDSTKGGSSPFDEAIYRSAKDSHVKIVSPYLGMNYLGRIVGLAKSWSLITDVNAWLESISRLERERALNFLHLNQERIHHCDMIHAKAAIGEEYAYFGSANLTGIGVLQRTELGVFIDARENLQELHDWFDSIWRATTAVDLEEATSLSRWLDNVQGGVARSASPKLSSSGTRISANYYSEPLSAAFDMRPSAITPGVYVYRSESKNQALSEVRQDGKAPGPEAREKFKGAVHNESQPSDQYAILDVLCTEVLKLVKTLGNPIPLHTPWSVLQNLSTKTRIPWSQVSKALTQSKESAVLLIDVRQQGSGCHINLEALTPNVLESLPRTAAAMLSISSSSVDSAGCL